MAYVNEGAWVKTESGWVKPGSPIGKEDQAALKQAGIGQEVTTDSERAEYESQKERITAATKQYDDAFAVVEAKRKERAAAEKSRDAAKTDETREKWQTKINDLDQEIAAEEARLAPMKTIMDLLAGTAKPE